MSQAWPTPSEPASTSRSLEQSDDELRAAFRELQTPRDIARLLDLPYWQLTYLIYRRSAEARYRAVSIKKKRGGNRALLVPDSSLSALQAKLAQVLAAVYRPKPCVFGFVRGGGIVQNARRHVGRRWVLNVDLQDFFPTINFGRVRGMFRAPPYRLPDAVATVLAQICCHQNQLPQGAPTSPAISNMVCARLDGRLMELAKRHRTTYTRFADDLTFSTTLPTFPTEIASLSEEPPLAIVGAELSHTIQTNGFQINLRKCRLQSKGQRQEVTGITVSQFPNVPRSFVRKTRAMLHAWEKFGYEAAQNRHWKLDHKHRAPGRPPPEFRNVVRGHLAYLSMVRGKADPIVLVLRTRYGKLDPAFAIRSPAPLHERVLAALWVLECDDEAVQGTAFAIDGLGLVTCEHVLGSATHAFRTTTPGIKHPVKVVARSKELDLAVLHVQATFGTALAVDRSYQPMLGDQVNIAGFPNYQTGDSGYFMAQRVASLRHAAGHLRVLVAGPIAAGMSGGPVVDSDGKVVGVIVSGAERLSQANMTERHGFVPSTTLATFLAECGLGVVQAPPNSDVAADEALGRCAPSGPRS